MENEISTRGPSPSHALGSATELPPASDPTHRLEPLAIPLGRVTLILRRRLWVVIAIFLLGVGITAVVVKGMPRKYTAEVSILVEPQRTQVSDLQAISADPGDIGTLVRTQIDILRSPTLAANIVKALKLTEVPEFAPKSGGPPAMLTALLSKLGMKPAAPTREPIYEDMVDIAGEMLSTKIAFFNEARSGVLRVDVTTQDAERSANIANELARQFLDYKRQAKFAAMQRAHDWFQEQMGLLSDQLRTLERDIETYRHDHRLDEDSPDYGDAPAKTETINRQQLDAISRQVSEGARDLALKEGELQQAQLALHGKVPVGTLPEVILSPLITQLLSQIATVEGHDGQLLSSQGPGNPELVSVRSQLQKLRLTLDREMNNVANSLSNQVIVARLQRSLLERRMEDLRNAVSVENSAQVGLRALQTKERATRGIYESFLNRATQLANVAGIQEQDASLVSAARAPLQS
jgi:polysaccharide biosynthesis transport protein